ncbi:type IV pilus assembly protein PilM [Candidatus Magnetobacterium bavaricum]|uniref:Type IV pilus assembly protein PilM n=1 Tax=Candidatus Magnetobacterium bavaricum TaxID=29290 RepID=A0A0F3GWI3_9BACT|nr:type IV pilus assembly protein PilM [Candidatus Magnetobacterium bavaricum]
MVSLFGSKSLLGLDIGSGSIKAVQLKDLKEGYELELLGIMPLHPAIIAEDSIADTVKLGEALKELIKKFNIKTKNTVISISGHSSVIIKRITLPEMTEEVLNENIRFEAEQYVPFGIEDVNLDYQIIGPAEEAGQIDVVLVAVKKDLLNSYVSVVKDVGLVPVIVDVDAFALENMYEINYHTNEEKNVALVNVGATNTTINILRNGVSAFTRDSSIGSKIHTDTLMRELSVSMEAAEKLKRGQEADGISAVKAEAVINSASEEIVMEITRSLDYFSDTPDIGSIDELMLGGGGSMVKGFMKLIEDRTGLSVAMMNPFNKVKIPKQLDARYVESVAPLAAVAVGLAMRRVGDR